MPRLFLLALAGVLLSHAALADAAYEQQLTLKNHTFTPDQVTLPKNQKIKLTLINEDPAAAEFESYDLHREKVVGANGTITLFFGPLDSGTYSFFDDFHRDTTRGTFLVK